MSGLALFAACATPGCSASGDGSAGNPAGNGTPGGSGTIASAGTGTAGSNTAVGGGGATGATGTAGSTTGSAGTSVGTTGGTGAGVAGAGGGSVGTAGAGGTNTGTAGTTGTAGAGGAHTGGTGGTAAGGTTGAAGAGPTVHESATCKIPTWPTATGTPVTISGTKSVSGTYDGKMALHNGDLNDCTNGDQSSTKPIIEIADGGTVKNIVFGPKAGDGIHCLGSCTIDNVWFPYVCDDAITMLGGSGKTATITNSGFKGARDKTIQHNGDGSTVVLNNIYVETAGKLYRSCGQGCDSSEKRTAKISNIVAIGASQIAGVSTNDTATLTNICAYRTPSLCRTYKPGTETETTIGSNGTDEGPTANCIYKSTDTHALLDDVTGSFTTDALCPGPNSIKVGSTATACVSGFDSCLRNCAPGGFGFRQANCTGGVYTNAGAVCALPSDTSIAAHFASTNSTSATQTETNNDPCTTEWAWGSDGTGKYCMCVPKPGYYQAGSGWWVWDCQSPWW